MPNLTYPIPLRYLNDNLAPMLFWDAFFYLLQTEGEKDRQGIPFIEFTYEEVEVLTSLSDVRRVIDVALQLPPPYTVKEEPGIRPYSYLLKLEQADAIWEKERIILKPGSFVGNGWLRLLNQPYPGKKWASRFPLAVVNQLLRKPGGRGATVAALQRQTQKPENKRPPDKAEIVTALTHLLALGLVERVDGEAERFRVCRARFDFPAAQAAAQMNNQRQTAVTALEQRLAAIDPDRAALAVELAQTGNFDLDQHSKEIFHALTLINWDTDLPLLTDVIKRRRNRPPSAQRWQDCWAAFERKVARASKLFCSDKEKVVLDRVGEQRVRLQIEPAAAGRVRWGKLVVWYNDKQYAFCGRPSVVDTAVTLQLWHDTTLLWERPLSYEDEVVRYDLTAHLQTIDRPWYDCVIMTKRPLPQVRLKMMLEAQYI